MALTVNSKAPAILKEWVKRLRGEGKKKYNQGRSCLRDGRGSYQTHCCLGVLSDMAVDAGVIKRFRGNEAFPGKKVLEWSGLRTEEGCYSNKSLAGQNDSGASFNSIANIIENNVDRLFTEPAALAVARARKKK